ncbi:MAG TPA: hypothetical protein VGP69_02085 [Gaiellaceae bacterium]|jgi:hypothetical protein|nr:hypothetical protein [Gaiellaceae bacterium]
MTVRRPRRLLPLLLLVGLLAAGASAASSPPATDRSIKLDLIAKLAHGPQILILGDSKGRQAEPSYLQRLTGHDGFNAAVMGGSTPDAWVFTRYAADRFPNQKRRYVLFVSAGLLSYIADPRTKADPRGQRYLQEVTPYLSTQTETVDWPKHPFTGYRSDGSLRARAWPPSPEHVKQVKAEAAALVAKIQQHPPVAPRYPPKRYELFEHLLGYLNARGERPVIVFNALYPSVYAALKSYGDPVITSSLDYLRSLRARYDFVVVDCENVHTWGGTASDWSNAGHVNRFNMRRMLRYIVAHSDGALR